MIQMVETLTQAEMDELLAYATSKGIGLIPAVNSPGYMDAILVAMEKLGIENPQATFDTVSKTTMDLTNEKQSISPRPHWQVTWTTSKASLRSLTTEQMNTPMMLPMPKAGTTSNGMTSMVNLRTIPIVLAAMAREKRLATNGL